MRNKQVGKNVKGHMIQNSTVKINTTIDEITNLVSQGRYEDVAKILKTQESIIGVMHPKYPYYSLATKKINENIIFYSKPMSKEAIEKYPPKIKGKIKFDNKDKNFKNITELLDFSYKTQTNIKINEIELKKMIGEEVDPYQEEINMLLSNTKDWQMVPKEFPKARPYKINIEGSAISYDYILLRTTKIEGSKIYLSNKEQGIDIVFKIMLDISSNKMTINMKINEHIENKNSSILKHLKFTKSALSKNKFSIISLELDSILAEGILDNFNYDSPFGNIDNEIVFIEYITLIEQKYNTKIKIPKIIEADELENIYYLGEAIKYGGIKGTWEEATFNFIIDEATRSNINNLDDKPFDLTFVGSGEILVLGKKYPVSKISRTLKNAYVKKLKKTKEKVFVLEYEDIIKVTFIANGNSKYIESFEF